MKHFDDEIVTVIATGFGGKNPALPKDGNSKKGYDGLYNPAKKERFCIRIIYATFNGNSTLDSW